MGTVIVVVGVENQDMFGLFTVNIGENQRLATPSEWLSTMKKSIGSNYVSDKTITVDGEKGVQPPRTAMVTTCITPSGTRMVKDTWLYSSLKQNLKICSIL